MERGDDKMAGFCGDEGGFDRFEMRISPMTITSGSCRNTSRSAVLNERTSLSTSSE